MMDEEVVQTNEGSAGAFLLIQHALTPSCRDAV